MLVFGGFEPSGDFDVVRSACPARRSWQDAAIYTHGAAIILSFHLISSVTHLSERDHNRRQGSFSSLLDASIPPTKITE